ncbi:MAG: hypothetical protein WCH99_14575 [Verrucomicrobiota bacterium]
MSNLPNDGLIDISADGIFPAFYDHILGCYWIADDRGEYIRISEKSLSLRLRNGGHSRQADRNVELSPLEQQILQIQDNHAIGYAAPLAGHCKGLYATEGQKILVVNSPKLITPQAGSWPTLDVVFSGLLGHQTVYLYCWLKVAIELLRRNQRGPGQALVLAGEHDCGKSLIQNLITHLLGGRSAKPYRYMTEQSSFNSELFAAEHLMIEDEPASSDLRVRRKFGAYIKIVTVNETQSFHAKNRPALTLKPFWRITISLNIEPHNLLILPELDDSICDKMILVKATRFPMPMPTRTATERKAFWDKLISELPAFVDFLLKSEIPHDLRSERFGITHYHHPEIRKAIDAVSPEMRMLDLIDRTMFSGKSTPWEGTAADLKIFLEITAAAESHALFDYDSAAGTYLGLLAKKFPNRVQKRSTSGGNLWFIHPPAPK